MVSIASKKVNSRNNFLTDVMYFPWGKHWILHSNKRNFAPLKGSFKKDTHWTKNTLCDKREHCIVNIHI
jgi:hypothetical protein